MVGIFSLVWKPVRFLLTWFLLATFFCTCVSCVCCNYWVFRLCCVIHVLLFNVFALVTVLFVFAVICNRRWMVCFVYVTCAGSVCFYDGFWISGDTSSIDTRWAQTPHHGAPQGRANCDHVEKCIMHSSLSPVCTTGCALTLFYLWLKSNVFPSRDGSKASLCNLTQAPTRSWTSSTTDLAVLFDSCH